MQFFSVRQLGRFQRAKLKWQIVWLAWTARSFYISGYAEPSSGMPLPTDQRQRQKIIDYNAIANRKDAISDNALKQPLKKSICFCFGSA
jgi:hypothetical protein